MANVYLAVIFTITSLAVYLGYTLGVKDTEHEYNAAARDARQRERENSRRFADLVRQTKSI